MKGLFSLLLFASLACSASAALTLKRLNESYATSESARCLDGSAAAYWYETGLGSNRTKFVFFIEGGGFCGSEWECKNRANGTKGSTKGYAFTVLGEGILSTNLTENPDFATWTHIRIPYCSGDLHSATRTVNDSSTWGLWFCGHNIIKAIVKELESLARLATATDIVWAGGSAGGVGSWVNVDYLASRVSVNTKVVVLPNAGFFSVETPFPGGNTTLEKFPIMVNLWQSHVPPACNATTPAANISLCLLAERGAIGIPQPIFWVQAVCDTNLMEAQLGFPGFPDPYASTWVPALYNSRIPKLQSVIFSRGDWGWWVTSSFAHGIDEKATCIRGRQTWLTTFGNFYFNRSGPRRLFDECGSTAVAQAINAGSTSPADSCDRARNCTPTGLTYAPGVPPANRWP